MLNFKIASTIHKNLKIGSGNKKWLILILIKHVKNNGINASIVQNMHKAKLFFA